MKKVRQLHLYLGTLFAPLIVFFALTGIFQTLELHEGPDTPAWIAQIASVHKHQALQSGEPKRPRSRQAAGGGSGKVPVTPEKSDGDEAKSARGSSPWPLKWFVVLMSVELVFTSGLGVYMSFKYERSKALVWGLLLVGTLLPLTLLWI